MKKLLALLLVAVMAFSLAACETVDAPAGEAAAPAASDTLVVYTTVSQNTIDRLIPMFEEQTGIKVELVTAKVGELAKRIEAERENPQGDILWGAGISSIQSYDKTLFMPYRSTEYDAIYDHYHLEGDYYIPYAVAIRCFLVNNDLIGDTVIDSYASLLQPELKGKIAMADPTATSSAYGQFSNMLFGIGKGDPESEASWEYIKGFCEALDGKLLDSSGKVWKGVCDGEYTVGLTYGEVAEKAVADGYPVSIVYPSEGSFIEGTCIAVIAGCKNEENAKKFEDFILSHDVQMILSNELYLRGVRNDLEAIGVDLSEIPLADADSDLSAAKKKEWNERFMDIWTSVAE